MTTVSVGNTILATEFNDLRNRLNDLWNVGSGDRGYGQNITSNFVAVGIVETSDAYLCTSSNGKIWTEQTNPKNVTLRDVVFSFSLDLFVAVGSLDGTDAYIITSPNSIRWSEQANPKNLTLISVTWSEELTLFVAVGIGDGTDAYIITSPDGVVWTERSNPKSIILRSIVWSTELTLFVAVGDLDGTDAYIITSPDGIAWTERSNPKNFVLLGVEWSSNLTLFVAVGVADGTDAYIITSPDGTTWTERSNPKNITLEDVIWSAELTLFTVVGTFDGATDAYIITSPDGVVWTERSNPKNITLRGVSWSKDVTLFVAVGDDDGTDAYLITSPDGIAWTERENPKNSRFHGVTFRPPLTLPDQVTAGVHTVDADRLLEFRPVIIDIGKHQGSDEESVIPGIADLEAGIDVALAAHNNDFNTAITTIETNRLVSPFIGQVDIQHIDCRDNVGSVLPGKAFILFDDPNNTTYSVWYEDNIFVAVGAFDAATDAYLITSPTGLSSTWTEQTNPINETMRGITWSPQLALWVIVGDKNAGFNYGSIMTSPDGITWTARSHPTATFAADLKAVVWDDGESVSGGQFIAVGSESALTDCYILTSPDGITWTLRSIPKGVTAGVDLRAITWASSLGLFCAVGDGDSGDAYIVTSSDGITWNEQTNPETDRLLGITWSPELSLFCAIGLNDGVDAYIITSSNGTAWTQQTNPLNILLASITWSPELTLFVAVGGISSGQPYIVTSPNGTAWTQRTGVGGTSMASVIWSKSPLQNRFVAVGALDTIIISTDGITWTVSTGTAKNIFLNAIASGHNAGSGTDPTEAGNVSLRIDIDLNDTAAQIATKTAAEIDTIAGFPFDATVITVDVVRVRMTEPDHSSDRTQTETTAARDSTIVPTGHDSFTVNQVGINAQFELKGSSFFIMRRTTSWGAGNTALGDIVGEISQTFDTANEARHYYNTGSNFNIDMSRTGGAGSSQNTDWTTLLDDIGDVTFTHTDTDSESTPSGETDTTIGFFDLTASYQIIYTSQPGAGAYTANEVEIRAKLDVAHPNAKVVTWEFTFTDDHTNIFGDEVDGTLDVNMVRTLTSIDKVVASSPIYAVVGGGDFFQV